MNNIERLTDESGQRWYCHEEDRENPARWGASVTNILSIVVPPKRQAYHERTEPETQKTRKQYAGDWGSAMHALIERDLRGDVARLEDVDEGLGESFGKWLALRDEHGISAEHVETMVFSDLYGYGGTFDLIGECDGKRALMDIKTGYVGVNAGQQMAAYRQAWFEMTGELLPTITISIPRNGKPAKLFESEHYDWQWHAFLGIFQAWKSLEFYRLQEQGWEWLHRGYFEQTAAEFDQLKKLLAIDPFGVFDKCCLWCGEDDTHSPTCAFHLYQQNAELTVLPNGYIAKTIAAAAGAICSRCAAGDTPHPIEDVVGDGESLLVYAHQDHEICDATNIWKLLAEKVTT